MRYASKFVALIAGVLLVISCNDVTQPSDGTSFVAGGTVMNEGEDHCQEEPCEEEPCEEEPCEEEEEEALGRMTGGGFQIRMGNHLRISRGFTIHCDITLSNNVQINWAGGNKWHIDKPLEVAICTDDPAVNPEPPPAPFDTFYGEATGRLNGVDGSFLVFTFVDAGEPGAGNDRAAITIWAPGDIPGVDQPVLDVPFDFIHGGNIQAHFDQPHS